MMAELVSLKEGICHASQHIHTYKHDMNVITFYILYNVEINSLLNSLNDYLHNLDTVTQENNNILYLFNCSRS